MAAGAYAQNPPGDTTSGTHIMVAGILFQLAAVIVFSCLFTWVIVKTLSNHASAHLLQYRKVQAIIAGTSFSVICVVIRSVYRTIELLQGWDGYLITTQRYFIVLDGVMMLLAVVVFNFISPGWASISNLERGNGTKSRYSNEGFLRTGDVELSTGPEREEAPKIFTI